MWGLSRIRREHLKDTFTKHTVCSLFRLVFFTNSMHLNFFTSFHGSVVPFLALSSSVLLLCNIPSSQPTSLFIHSPTERHLGCLQILAIMSKADRHLHMQVCVWVFISFV